MPNAQLPRSCSLWLVIALQSLLLMSCQSSVPKNYYVLTSEPVTIPTSSTPLEIKVGMGIVDIPEYLHFTQLVYQTQDGQLQRLANSYWAEPLDQGISRVLRLNLTQAAPNRQLIQYPWRSDNRPKYSIKINILTMNLADNQARIEALWTLTDLSEKAGTTANSGQRFSASLAAEPSATGLVKAYSQLLQRLSMEIDQALKTQT
ncbi:membrane integrity-associated transporter subunit PqiC [Shewanella sp. SR44-3]|uniref:PqiC family protein n=1 Tax=Shewanella sp. SR44-3 TaxID=2760936 RepID=UPI0015F98235|nr:PqiC family protein [Shewanella sp. SR44-3]MBB1268202.1 membrane integrity-associated transporter subunit PqiC [Shewanella sp. SR44-3]